MNKTLRGLRLGSLANLAARPVALETLACALTLWKAQQVQKIASAKTESCLSSESIAVARPFFLPFISCLTGSEKASGEMESQLLSWELFHLRRSRKPALRN
jgi:hypothetical protein